MRFQYRSLLISICVGVLGCGSAEPVNETHEKMVLVDTKTMNSVVQPFADSFPAINPQTGDRTLMPGLYCPVCKSWYPVPTADQINRRPDAALCPKTRTPLIADGPWPEEDPLAQGDGS